MFTVGSDLTGFLIMAGVAGAIIALALCVEQAPRCHKGEPSIAVGGMLVAGCP